MVKRVGHLMERIAMMENLEEAFLRAARGKSDKKVVACFRNDLHVNLSSIRYQLIDGSFPFGDYHFFVIHDPKRRLICAASFPERVVSQAIMRICHPVFDAYQISDSYASRKGKGQYKALDRARLFAKEYKWFVKLDVHKFFDSIDHNLLMSQLCRLFKDPLLLNAFQQLINSYETKKGRGLPIGNLTSQYFANHYLSFADHYAKECLGVKAMVRYMDDILIFSNNRKELLCLSTALNDYMLSVLHLNMHEPIVNKTHYGVPFLGYVVYPDMMRLNQPSRCRFKKSMAVLHHLLTIDECGQEDYTKRGQCLHAFIEKASVADYQYVLSHTKGLYPSGL